MNVALSKIVKANPIRLSQGISEECKKALSRSVEVRRMTDLNWSQSKKNLQVTEPKKTQNNPSSTEQTTGTRKRLNTRFFPKSFSLPKKPEKSKCISFLGLCSGTEEAENCREDSQVDLSRSASQQVLEEELLDESFERIRREINQGADDLASISSPLKPNRRPEAQPEEESLKPCFGDFQIPQELNSAELKAKFTKLQFCSRAPSLTSIKMTGSTNPSYVEKQPEIIFKLQREPQHLQQNKGDSPLDQPVELKRPTLYIPIQSEADDSVGNRRAISSSKLARSTSRRKLVFLKANSQLSSPIEPLKGVKKHPMSPIMKDMKADFGSLLAVSKPILKPRSNPFIKKQKTPSPKVQFGQDQVIPITPKPGVRKLQVC